MRKLIFLLVMLMMVVGCATTQTLNVQKRTRVYNADYVTVFKAAVDFCNANAFPIIMVDKDLGILNTGFKENDGVSKFFVGDKRTSFSLSIRECTDGTTVIAIISCEEKTLFGGWSQQTGLSSDAEALYESLFDKIESFIPKEDISIKNSQE